MLQRSPRKTNPPWWIPLAHLGAFLIIALVTFVVVDRRRHPDAPALFRVEPRPHDIDHVITNERGLCVHLLATYPYTGNTLLRGLWDIATGIPAQAVFPEGGTYTNITNAYSHRCGTNGGLYVQHGWQRYYDTRKAVLQDLVSKLLHIDPDEVTADFNTCQLIKRTSMRVQGVQFIKTHYPALDVNELNPLSFVGKTPDNICGIVLTDRTTDTEGWCRVHEKQPYFDVNTTAHGSCPATMKLEMEHFSGFWYNTTKSGGLFEGRPVLNIPFADVSHGGQIGIDVVRRLVQFANLPVNEARLELAAAIMFANYSIPN